MLRKNKTRLCYCHLVANVTFPLICGFFFSRMARGQQKIQSQAKAAEKSAKLKKQQGHSANDQKKAAQKALVHVCSVCKVRFLAICKFLEAYWYRFDTIFFYL